jgi:hypothetical protein
VFTLRRNCSIETAQKCSLCAGIVVLKPLKSVHFAPELCHRNCSKVFTLRRKTSIFVPFLSVHFAPVIGVQFAADYAR